MWDETVALENKVDLLEEKLREACHHLMWVWHQYGETHEGVLVHKDMGAGEDAGEFLQKLGYVECGGWQDKITEKGCKLMVEKF